ncbi:hypothetical protein C7C56_009170 [Massilia glaciei]|uniref:Uncharacterized protein n=2 Tax=Massilia glaciei TaxID=1524097 RepID=A0A2U2HNF2_9BURK|nr:hypothetical protein C7C56_009170 [Massilia glaciei]
MAAGLDAFDEHRKLAPEATLRFRLGKRDAIRTRKTNWDGVKLRLAGSETSTPIPIAADGTFVLLRSQEAYDDEADFLLNQKKSSIRFSPEVRTPGLPDNVRRLGDYRLECQVLIAIGKKELNFAMRAAFNAYALGGDWCSTVRKNFGISFMLPDWSINTTLTVDGKQKNLRTNGVNFAAPIQDKSLPDNALITFEYWSGASLERKQRFLAQFPIHLKSSADKWGAGQQMQSKGNTAYSTVIALKPGKWRFCLKSPDGELYLGAERGKTVVTPGSEHAALWHEYHNFIVDVEQAGNYEVSLDLQNPDLPVVGVKRRD